MVTVALKPAGMKKVGPDGERAVLYWIEVKGSALPPVEVIRRIWGKISPVEISFTPPNYYGEVRVAIPVEVQSQARRKLEAELTIHLELEMLRTQ